MGIKSGGTIDFDTHKAIAMICDNGATIPASPAIGQWFLHTPTGRNILMTYNGSSWIPIMSLGPMTVYVDKTDGSDSIDKGGAIDAGAVATIQYAIDLIPGQIGGNVTININAESYAEAIEIRGKGVTGNYTITLNGTLTSQGSGTWSANGVKGTTTTQGTGTDIGNFAGNSYANLLLLEGGDSTYRIIDSHTDDVITITGIFSSQPLNTETWEVFDWGTSITSYKIHSGQQNVRFNDLKFTATSYTYLGGEVELLRCEHSAIGSWSLQIAFGSQVKYNTCILLPASHGIQVTGLMYLWRTKMLGTTGSVYGLAVPGYCYLRYGCIIDNFDRVGRGGADVYTNGTINFYSTDSYNRIRNCGSFGVYAHQGGMAVYATGKNQYSGNGTNESAVAASYGYIN